MCGLKARNARLSFLLSWAQENSSRRTENGPQKSRGRVCPPFKAIYLGLRVGLGTMTTLKTCHRENDNRQTDTAVPPAGVTSSTEMMQCMMNHNTHANAATFLLLSGLSPPLWTNRAVGLNETYLAFSVYWSHVHSWQLIGCYHDHVSLASPRLSWRHRSQQM